MNDTLPTGDDLQEREFIDAALAGDVMAERALYEAHVERVFRLAYRMTGDQELAEDFTQEAFLRAFQHLPGFRGQAAFATWLHSIASSVVLNGLRRVRRWRQMETWEEKAPETGKEDDDAVLKIKLDRAIGALPDDLRAVFLMHDAEGYTHREIAAVLAIPEGTAKAQLARARQRLRDALGEAGRTVGGEA